MGLASVSIVIPAYNEETRLPATLYAVLGYLRTSARWQEWEILVVDDGSVDGTAAVAEAVHAEEPRVALLRNPGNRGKGYSVRHGMLAGKHEWVLFSDADLSTPIEELDSLYEACKQRGCPIAIASRAIDRSLIEERQSLLREFGGRGMNLLMRLIVGLDVADTQCGFKLFTREAAQSIFPLQTIDGFGFDPEVLFIARKLGYRFCEIPARWKHVEGTKVRLVEDSLRMVADFVRIRRNDLAGRYGESAPRD
ncbi:MAG: dolichyl-phosphate beta-glucosyltransferase [Bryobacterales bacterium]|nr:dolichyl-phosphate beta-glucosyltransferase [Bryobacterales bacterium]